MGKGGVVRDGLTLTDWSIRNPQFSCFIFYFLTWCNVECLHTSYGTRPSDALYSGASVSKFTSHVPRWLPLPLVHDSRLMYRGSYLCALGRGASRSNHKWGHVMRRARSAVAKQVHLPAFLLLSAKHHFRLPRMARILRKRLSWLRRLRARQQALPRPRRSTPSWPSARSALPGTH